MPSINAIITGLAFLFFGLLLVLCDRWPTKITVQGSKTSKAHQFDHLFLLWFFKQTLQFLLLPLWFLIDRNILGFGRFKHGEVQPRGRKNIPLVDVNNLPNQGGADELPNAQNQIVNEEADGAGDQVEDNHDIPLLPKRNRRIQKPSALLYFPAAFFAQAGVLLLYFGVKLTYESSYIMLKGTAAFFTALLSMAFLAQQLACYVWFGVIVATMGFAVSGISDYVHNVPDGYEKYGIAAGDLLIVMSQIMFATQIIYEEKFIRKYSIHPMCFLGAEGVYGFFFSGIFLILFNVLDLVQYSTLPNGKLEDIADAMYQLGNSWQCALSFLGSIIFYIFYTYLGMFLIRDQGALPRIMVETLLWTVYWAIALAVKWDGFFIAQVPGLCVIPIGVLIYSHILVIPFGSCGEKPDVQVPDIYAALDANVNNGEDNPNQNEQDGNGHIVNEIEEQREDHDAPLMVDVHQNGEDDQNQNDDQLLLP